MGDLWRILIKADFLCVAVNVGKRLLQKWASDVQFFHSSGQPFTTDLSPDKYHILGELVFPGS